VIDPRNERSARVAQRLGTAPLRNDTVHGTAVVIWGIDRPG
jgi:RimJ/RimL family protein N-acetyltransferase